MQNTLFKHSKELGIQSIKKDFKLAKSKKHGFLRRQQSSMSEKSKFTYFGNQDSNEEVENKQKDIKYIQ